MKHIKVLLASFCSRKYESLVPARKMKLRVRDLGNYSCLKVDLIFTRDRAFYFTTVFIPGIILVTSSFITFWLEWNAVPARVMIGESAQARTIPSRIIKIDRFISIRSESTKTTSFASITYHVHEKKR